MKTIAILLLTIIATCLLFSKEKPSKRIDLRNIEFRNVFKTDDGDWTQMELELVALDTSTNKRNPKYFENVEITVTIAYPNQANSGSNKNNQKKFVFFRAKTMLSLLKEKRIVKIYFFLPGDVAEYYQLKKRPKYSYVNFVIDGEALPPHTDYLDGSLAPKDLVPFLAKAALGVNETKGKLLPHHLAPQYVKKNMDRKMLPTLSRKTKDADLN